MGTLRTFILSHRYLAALLIAAALCMKMSIPAGTMVGSQNGALTVQICAEQFGQVVARQITIESKGAKSHPGKAGAEAPCAFTALSLATLGGADSIQLAIALLFILALGFAPILSAAPRRIAHLRPPLRGPPAIA